MKVSNSAGTTIVSTLLVATLTSANNQDRFNYYENRENGYDHPPASWGEVTCDNPGECMGYPNAWLTPMNRDGDWSITGEKNECEDCTDYKKCGYHTQCPFNLERNRAIQDTVTYKECIDVHWMAFYDGSCTWEDIVDNKRGATHRNNFFIRRDSLQVMMPLDDDGNLKCRDATWPKLDYSKGFPDWWYLDHLEMKVPGEWTQEGKRYDAQITMSQWYEKTWDVQPRAGSLKKIGNVLVNMEAKVRAEPNAFIDKLICQFRKTEDEVRNNCGIESIGPEHDYPGCWSYNRQGNQARDRNLRTNTNITVAEEYPPPEPRPNIPDFNHIVVEPHNFDPEPPYDFDAWYAEQREKKYVEEAAAAKRRKEEDDGVERQEQEQNNRELFNYDEVEFHAYQPLIDCKTEYYFRLEGRTTTPPCQAYTHWRIMKDPLIISIRQLKEIERLIAMRVAPRGSSYKECRYDTAGKVERPEDELKKVNVARPIQEPRGRHQHKLVFCECDDWPSKWQEDREWCQLPRDERFYEQPYNFKSNGF
mmetsp:Transcript_16507/g.23283  ORF Transcript_16507/g.23283 Transcript_16507/m.23283 type:complete len:532 (+) Transcript_16507:109-1704(+)